MNTDYQQPRLDPAKGTQLFRSGFTLIELLVVLAIIGILMAIVVGAIRGANQDTLVSKTRGTIAKIDSILNDRYDEYLSVPLSYVSIPTGTSPRVGNFPTVNTRVLNTKVSQLPDNTINWPGTGLPPISLLRERVRLASTRDLMRMEMPDCPGDLVDMLNTTSINSPPDRAGAFIATGYRVGTNGPFVFMQLQTTGRFELLFNKMFPINPTSPPTRDRSKVVENANAELLYLIIEDSTLNGSSAIEAFGNSEIADTDNDGLFEFIDAWGKPIRWLRCPAGINSTARFDPDPLNPAGTQPSDPFDPTKADVGFDPVNLPNPINLPNVGQRPLIVSAGVDGRFGIRFFGVTAASIASPQFSTSAVTLNQTTPTFPRVPVYGENLTFVWPDPFYPRNFLTGTPSNPVDMRLGAVLDETGNVDTVRDPIGVDYSVNPISLIPNPETNTNYIQHSQDNVSNLDETGASL